MPEEMLAPARPARPPLRLRGLRVRARRRPRPGGWSASARSPTPARTARRSSMPGASGRAWFRRSRAGSGACGASWPSATPPSSPLRVRIEDKGPIYAFHWRGVPDEEARRAMLQGVAQEAQADGLDIHWGRKVLEIRPPVPVDKGQAVRDLVGERDGAQGRALRRRRRDRPRRVRRLRRAAWPTASSTRRSGWACAPTRGRPRSSSGPTWSSTGPGEVDGARRARRA